MEHAQSGIVTKVLHDTVLPMATRYRSCRFSKSVTRHQVNNNKFDIFSTKKIPAICDKTLQTSQDHEGLNYNHRNDYVSFIYVVGFMEPYIKCYRLPLLECGSCFLLRRGWVFLSRILPPTVSWPDSRVPLPHHKSKHHKQASITDYSPDFFSGYQHLHYHYFNCHISGSVDRLCHPFGVHSQRLL